MTTHTPRPLHLVTNSIASTPTTDVSSSPIPPPSFRHPKRYSMIAAPTTYSSQPTTPSTPSAQTKASRRKSSIAYFAPDSTSNSRRGSLIRRNSLGALSESLSVVAESGGRVPSWTKPGDRSGVISLPASVLPGAESAPETPAPDRLPLTLTEKHADLLRFIAQKESKCLDLRSQLAMHEAELAELKRKWQRIVNRGLDRDGLQSSSAHGSISIDASSVVFDGIKEGVQGMSRLLSGFSSHTVPSSPALSSSAVHHLPASKRKPRPPSLIHKAHSTKESESSSASTYASSRSANTTGRFSQSSMSSFDEDGSGGIGVEVEESRNLSPGNGEEGGEGSSHANESDDTTVQILMVRDTGATPTMSPNPEFHQQRQQQKQRHQRFTSKNQNCVSASYSSTSPGQSPTIPSASASTSLIGGDFDGQTRASEVQVPSSTARASLSRRKSQTQTQPSLEEATSPQLDFRYLDFSTLSPCVMLSPPPSVSQSPSDTTSPDVSSRIPSGSSPSRSPRLNSTSPNGLKSPSASNLAGSSGTGLPPMSSIPGLGLAAGSSAAVPVSLWMDSMGKKIGQLQRSSTFTKNQKRASLLLADMSNSIVNVLAPSPNPNTSSNSSTQTRQNNTLDVHGTSVVTRLAPKVPSSPNPSSTGSLLDNEDEDEAAAKLLSSNSGVLKPVTAGAPPMGRSSSATSGVLGPNLGRIRRVSVEKKKRNFGRENEKGSGDFDDEEWNW